MGGGGVKLWPGVEEGVDQDVKWMYKYINQLIFKKINYGKNVSQLTSNFFLS